MQMLSYAELREAEHSAALRLCFACLVLSLLSLLQQATLLFQRLEREQAHSYHLS